MIDHCSRTWSIIGTIFWACVGLIWLAITVAVIAMLFGWRGLDY